MKTTAVICELNPIHPGHAMVLELAKKENDVVIAVMSGNFTQRGIPAVYDKYVRAEAAVRCGADLAVELPFPWCSSGTEFFAMGGAAEASGMGAFSLTFGSETGSLALPEKLAEVKSSPDYAETVRNAEKASRERGSAVIFDELLRTYGITGEIGPNDKLGGEYIRYGRGFGIDSYCAVARMKEAPSASAVREVLYRDGLEACADMTVGEAYPVFEKARLCRESELYRLFFQHARLYIRSDEESDILRYAAKTASAARDPEEFIANLATRKYTLSRMRRELLFSMLGVTADDYRAIPEFTVLLAANKTGREYLGAGKFAIPIITKPSDQSALSETAKVQYAASRRADELYALLTGLTADAFIKKHPVIL